MSDEQHELEAPAPEPAAPKSSKPHSVAKRVLIGIAAVIVVVVLSFVVSAFGLKTSASSLLANVDTLQEQVISGDLDGAVTTVQSMRTTSNGMVSELNSPLWNAVGAIWPEVGSDIKNSRTVVSILNQLCSDVLVPLATELQETTKSGLMQDDGSFNLEAVQSLLNLVEETAPVMQDCADEMASVPTMKIARLQEAMASAKEKFASVNELYQQAASLAPIANKLLGGEGSRNYLIVAQNSAETRSLGGFPGALGLLTIDNGTIALGEFGTPYELLTDDPVAELTSEEYTLFGNGYNDINNPRNDALFVDYTRVADIWAQSFETKTGTHVNGVVSVTPSVVQDLLTLADPVTLSDGTVVDGTNATKVLQHDLYWSYLSETTTETGGNDKCDELFAEAAKGAFHSIVSNLSVSTLKSFIQVMLEDVDKGTLMVWLTAADEQEVIEQLNCSGAINADETAPEAGVFVGFASGSKLGWYLDCNVSVGDRLENSDGTSSYTVTVTLRNTITEEEAAQAGTYIAGLWGGSADLLVHLTAPAGGTISDVLCSSRSTRFTVVNYQGTTAQDTEDSDGSGTGSYSVSGSGYGYSTQSNGYANQAYGYNTQDIDEGESGIELAYNPNVLWIEPEGTVTLTYIVTTSANAEQPLAIRQTPTLTQYRQAE